MLRRPPRFPPGGGAASQVGASNVNTPPVQTRGPFSQQTPLDSGTETSAVYPPNEASRQHSSESNFDTGGLASPPPQDASGFFGDPHGAQQYVGGPRNTPLGTQLPTANQVGREGQRETLFAPEQHYSSHQPPNRGQPNGTSSSAVGVSLDTMNKSGYGGAFNRGSGMGVNSRVPGDSGFIISRSDNSETGHILPTHSPSTGAFYDQSRSRNVEKGNHAVLMTLVAVVVCCLIVSWFSEGQRYLFIVLSLCGCGLLFAKYISNWVLNKDSGASEMREISDPIFEGAQSFLRVQYTAIARLAGFVAFLIFLSYKLRPEFSGEGIDALGGNVLGTISAISFILGAVCSALAGYVSMWVSAHANVRVASAAKRSYLEAMVICFRGGAFSSILVIAMCVAGISILHGILHWNYVPQGNLKPTDIPLLTVGYGFGASFVALFMQLGGGIYTKAADIGADMVGKIEAGIPEDDPRNPAVIADLVGDMVGDCVGSSADIFESVAAEIIGAMILGGSLANEAETGIANPLTFVYFPLMIHAFDILVSSVGVLSLGDGRSSWVTNLTGFGSQKMVDPMGLLKRGFLVATVLAFGCFAVSCYWMLYSESSNAAWLHFFGCGIVGMVTSYVFVLSTQYYTDYQYSPVQSIAAASETGHGTNIITGVSVGMISTCIPVLMVSFSVIASYWLGRTSGIGSGHNGGLFGTAVATMGMLSSAAYILAMNNYGPIADNAGGIVEMSSQPEQVRASTDMLDAAVAYRKGYSVGSAALACFLLFGALLDEFSAYSQKAFHSVDITIPEVLIGGLLGVMMIFFFVGLTVAAVGRTAGEVVKEVRRQFKENPDIIEGTMKPNYGNCVKLVTQAALKEMVLPGILTVAMPVTLGLVFRSLGEMTERPLLGAAVLCAFVMFATVTGILMALFLDNVGGAWDNAKKYVESGKHGGKHSEAHKAAITGDTVGDPFKDTAGPALHVVIKLLSTTILVLAPLFVGRAA